MKEVTHCHNQRPIYEVDGKEIFEWNNPKEVSGETKENYSPIYHPFIIDIETSAQLGQRPILLVGYNSLEDRLIVLYSYGYMGYTLNNKRVKELTKGLEPSKLTLHNLSISNFEKFVLKPIADWNKKARKRNDENRISLVAHNAAFDIPMLGTPDDKLLENPKIGEQYEQAVQYKDFKMVGHRAGQFGQIYTFLDSSKNYEPQYIPVGDTMVTSQALWIPAKLEKACEKMDVSLDVSVSEEHGVLNDEYVEYCINDVIATYKLYLNLQDRINNMIGDLPIEHIYSTASIGKYVLRTMGYKRTGYSQNAVDVIAPSYFGGRTDAEITGEIIENLRYTDILSEYPTVSKLTKVWEYMQAEQVVIEQIDPSELPKPKDLTKSESWSEISDYYVKIKPNGATLPVRTPHLDETTKVVTSKVWSEEDLHYHYMDVVSADLIDGERKADIVAAWEVKKAGMQDLESTSVGGVKINPNNNVMTKCIESRKEIQVKNKSNGIGDKDGKNVITLFLKIIANSLYGVSAERIVKEKDEDRHDYASETGFYNPHVAATITAGGRLMLALGERKAKEGGGELVYCDTDSLIIPDKCADYVIDSFKNLNPYDGVAGDMDVLEDEKGQSGNLYAVGTKKYIFFSENGEPLEVKEHGLGNYDNLRGKICPKCFETIKSKRCKACDYNLDDKPTIVERLWATIMSYDLGKNPLNVPILYDGKLNELVLWSFNASTVSMRTMVDDMTNDYIRYGDWLQSTLSYDNEIRYIALNLMEKDEEDEVVRVTTEDEEIIKIEKVHKQEMDMDKRLKTVKDVVMKFVQDTIKVDERPKVNVTELKAVTKESTSRKDIFMAKLEEQFNENMCIASKLLYEKDLSVSADD